MAGRGVAWHSKEVARINGALKWTTENVIYVNVAVLSLIGTKRSARTSTCLAPLSFVASRTSSERRDKLSISVVIE